jgi:hypothetical protein
MQQYQCLQQSSLPYQLVLSQLSPASHEKYRSYDQNVTVLRANLYGTVPLICCISYMGERHFICYFLIASSNIPFLLTKHSKYNTLIPGDILKFVVHDNLLESLHCSELSFQKPFNATCILLSYSQALRTIEKLRL